MRAGGLPAEPGLGVWLWGEWQVGVGPQVWGAGCLWGLHHRPARVMALAGGDRTQGARAQPTLQLPVQPPFTSSVSVTEGLGEG